MLFLSQGLRITFERCVVFFLSNYTKYTHLRSDKQPVLQILNIILPREWQMCNLLSCYDTWPVSLTFTITYHILSKEQQLREIDRVRSKYVFCTFVRDCMFNVIAHPNGFFIVSEQSWFLESKDSLIPAFLVKKNFCKITRRIADIGEGSFKMFWSAG